MPFRRRFKLRSILYRSQLLGSLAAVVFGVSACGSNTSQLEYCRNMAKDPKSQGACNFFYNDWDTFNQAGLEQNVVPIKAIAVSLVLDQPAPSNDHERVALQSVMVKRLQAFFEGNGLFVPDEIANAKDVSLDQVVRSMPIPVPMGVTAGTVGLPVGRVSGAVFSCASCHSGRLYDEKGKPTRKAWIGLPNTSYNPQTLTAGLFDRLGVMADKWSTFMDQYEAAFGVGFFDPEVIGLKILKGSLTDKVKTLRETTHGLRPFPLGSPGMTNGIPAVEFNLGIYQHPEVFHPEDQALVGMPALFDRTLKSSLLSDGIYSIEGEQHFREIEASSLTTPSALDARIWELSRIAAIFTIGTVGTQAENAPALVPEVAEAMSFVQSRRPPPFPGKIDSVRALRGAQTFSNRCESCHGRYEGQIGHANFRLVSFPNVLVSVDKIGTDSARVDRMRPEALQTLRSLKVAEGISIEPHNGYVSPVLTGLWATAPYLHNGSVPSLWDLMHPETRPAKFQVGGHALDFAKVGVAYPAGYQPFMKPETYDTSQPGHRNTGHERPFDKLNEDEKSDLLEFLKLL